MTWATAWQLLKAFGGLLRAVPMWVWLVAALLIAWHFDRGEQYQAGVDAEKARQVAAQLEADREAKAKQDERDQDAAQISRQSDERAQDAVVETRTETAAAVERVRYETRVIEVPVGCDRPLPVGLRDEFAKAVDAANAASRGLRAGADP